MIDIVRMDIEGAEWDALRGMSDIFAAGPPPVCFIEIHPKYLTADEQADIYQTLDMHGYRLELAIAESVVASPWPGQYEVSSFEELERVERVHCVIAVQTE